jgi:hypothetical protein
VCTAASQGGGRGASLLARPHPMSIVVTYRFIGECISELRIQLRNLSTGGVAKWSPTLASRAESGARNHSIVFKMRAGLKTLPKG